MRAPSNTTGSLSWVPAKESRKPSLPATRGGAATPAARPTKRPRLAAESQTSSPCAMVATSTWTVGRNRWQSAQLDFSTQGINDPQHVFQSQGGFAGFKVDNEAHTNPCREGQLGLGQPELFASGTSQMATTALAALANAASVQPCPAI